MMWSQEERLCVLYGGNSHCNCSPEWGNGEQHVWICDKYAPILIELPMAWWLNSITWLMFGVYSDNSFESSFVKQRSWEH